jgi:hypothetical protein
MAGLGRKTFNSGDVLNAADVQGYLMDQAVMVFAGTAARGSAIPTPSAGMVAYSTATQLQVYNGSAWVDLSTGYGVATGGSSSSITVGGINYTLLTFTSDSTLTVTKSGLFDVLAVGGGAGGGVGGSGCGGGGAGSLVQSTIYLTANASITVGAGGAAGTVGGTTDFGAYGFGSKVGTLISTTGGGGGGGDINMARAGGCGGGGRTSSNATFNAGAKTLNVGFGNNGGDGSGDGSVAENGSGGGGGTGAVGGNSSGTTGGAGGAGTDVSTFIGGSALFKGGGGGGGGGTGGAGGSSVGGAGGSTGGTGGTAAANTGSGGGGATALGAAGAGGSGIVYVRFKV